MKLRNAQRIGARAIAPTDGYTLLFVHAAMLATQAVFQRYDLFKQFVPVVGMGQTDITFVVSGKKPYKTIQELIDYGRANPGKLSYVSPGAGTLEHLALANLCQRYGIDAVHVPLKGSVEVVKALIQGEGDFSTLAVPLVQQFGAKGMVRALVVLNEKRNAAIPDVPTYKEEKLDVPRLTVWAGLAVPVGTPQEAIDYLEKASLEAAGNPELQKQLRSAGMDPAAIPAADFGKTWKADYAWIAKAAAEAKPNLTN